MNTSARPSFQPRNPSDRRRSVRVPHVCEAWLSSPTATSEDDKIEVTSLNISRHGVGFELARELPVGSFYVIEIGVGDQRLCSEIRLASCKKQESGLFEVGAEFC